MLRAILIDDEENSIETLEYELQYFSSDIQVVGTCSDPRKAKALLEKVQPDVVFLDIEMPWMTGFEWLDTLDKINFHLVFVTAYDQFAIKAFDYFTIDYLLKPVSRKSLERTMEKISLASASTPSLEFNQLIQVLQQQRQAIKKIAFPVKNGYEFYSHEAIIRCEADSNYTKVFLLDEKPILVSKSLKIIDDMLQGANFFRSHQSHLINLAHIKKFDKSDGGSIIMIDNSHIPISRHKKNAFTELIKRL